MSRTSALPAYGTLRPNPFDLEVRSQRLGNTSTPQAKKESKRMSMTTKVALGVLGAFALGASIYFYSNSTKLTDLYTWTASFFATQATQKINPDPEGLCDPSNNQFPSSIDQADCLVQLKLNPNKGTCKAPTSPQTSPPTTQASTADQVAVCIEKLLAYSSDAPIRKIANALGGSNAFCNLPILLWQDRFAKGSSPDNINGVQAKDLSSSIMRGIDPHARPYVSIRIESRTSAGKTDVCVETLFQRFTKDSEPWVGDSIYEKTPVFGEVLNGFMIDQLRDLSSGKSIEFSRTFDGSVIRKRLV